jgi:hypothetical protein
MVDKQVNMPRTVFIPEFAGDFKRYSQDLNLALTSHIRELWARAESLDKNSNIQDGVIKTAYIENAAVGTAQIGLLAVTDALIASCSVGKLLAGSITSKVITLAMTEGAGDVCLKCGKTDFGDDGAGFILGADDSDSNKAKFEIGSATNYMKWDGAALTIRGSLVADDITTGTLDVARLSTASIDTIKLALNAATNAAATFNAAQVVCTQPAETEIGTVTIVRTGKPVLVTVTFQAYATAHTADINLYRGITLLTNYFSILFGASYGMFPVTFLDTDTGTGSTVYSAKINNPGTASIYAQNISMTAVEYKR